MSDIVRIRSRFDDVNLEFRLQHPRESYLQQEILDRLREETQKILNCDNGKKYDSVEFEICLARAPIERIARYIIENHKMLKHARWKGVESLVNDKSSETKCSENVHVSSHMAAHRGDEQQFTKFLTIEEAEDCAKVLVDMYHARYCKQKENDFENSNSLIPRKNSDGRRRTDVEMLVLSECDQKIDREIGNLVKRSPACKTELFRVVEKYREYKLSQCLSSPSCREWYHRVGSHIEDVCFRKIRGRESMILSVAEIESELHGLYPKGWFECHVFQNVEEIHPENGNSAPENIKNMVGSNDRNMQTELHHRNLYNSHEVARAYENKSRERQEHQAQLHDMNLRLHRQQALHTMETKKMKRIIEQNNNTCSLKDLQSGDNNTIQEIQGQQAVLNTQAPAKTTKQSIGREKENVNHRAENKDQVKPKRQPVEHRNPKELENPYKRQYTSNRRR